MADWTPAELVQKNNRTGEMRAKINGQWVPVAQAQKNSAGQYRVMLGGASAAPAAPAQPQAFQPEAPAAAPRERPKAFLPMDQAPQGPLFTQPGQMAPPPPPPQLGAAPPGAGQSGRPAQGPPTLENAEELAMRKARENLASARENRGASGKNRVRPGMSRTGALYSSIVDTIALPVNAPQMAARGLADITGLPLDKGRFNPFAGELFGEKMKRGLENVGINTKWNEDDVISQGINIAGGSIIPIAGQANRASKVVDATGKTVRQLVTQEAKAAAKAGAGGALAMQMFPDSPILAPILGAMAPQAGGLAFQELSRRTMRGGEKGRQTLVANRDAFREQGIEGSVGQLTGNKRTMYAEAGAGATPGGHAAMAAKGMEQQLAAKGRMQKIAGGARTSADEAGTVLQTGLRRHVDEFKRGADKKFEAVRKYFPGEAGYRTADNSFKIEGAGGRTFPTETTSASLASLTAQYPTNPALNNILTNSKIAALEGALPKQMTFHEMSRLRSQIGRQLADGPMVSDIPRAELKQLYAALSDDMLKAADEIDASSLGKAGGKGSARQALEQANDYYAQGLQQIEDSFERLITKTDPEKAYVALFGGKASAHEIKAVMKVLNTDEKQLMREVMLNRMGKARGSLQDADATVFSTESFLTKWSDISTEARDAMFGKGPMREDLDKIADTFTKIRNSSKTLANPSGSAALGITGASIFGALGGLATGSLGAATMVGGAVLSSYKLSKLMTDPKFVDWLAKSTTLPAERLPGHVTRLLTLSTGDPEKDADAKEFGRTLLNQADQLGKGPGNSRRNAVDLPQENKNADIAPMVSVRRAADRLDVEREFVNSLAQTESSGGKFLRNRHSSARGPLQVTRGTFEDMNRKHFDGALDWDSVDHQTLAGVQYIKNQLDSFNGDKELALAAYFIGPAKVNQLLSQGGRSRLLSYKPPKNHITVGGYVRKTLGG